MPLHVPVLQDTHALGPQHRPGLPRLRSTQPQPRPTTVSPARLGPAPRRPPSPSSARAPRRTRVPAGSAPDAPQSGRVRSRPRGPAPREADQGPQVPPPGGRAARAAAASPSAPAKSQPAGHRPRARGGGAGRDVARHFRLRHGCAAGFGGLGRRRPRRVWAGRGGAFPGARPQAARGRTRATAQSLPQLSRRDPGRKARPLGASKASPFRYPPVEGSHPPSWALCCHSLGLCLRRPLRHSCPKPATTLEPEWSSEKSRLVNLCLEFFVASIALVQRPCPGLPGPA